MSDSEFLRDIEKTVCDSRQIARSACFRVKCALKKRAIASFYAILRKRYNKNRKRYAEMSQEKVDRYKQEKANRKKNLAKEKMKKKLYTLAGVLVGVVAVVWIGFSFYWEAEEQKKQEAYSSSMAEFYSSYFDSILNGTTKPSTTKPTTSKDDKNTSSSSETTSGKEQSSDQTTSSSEKESNKEEPTTKASN